MGWARNALKQLKAGRPATVRWTGGTMRGLIEGGQSITLSPADPNSIIAGDVVLVRWKEDPRLFLVKDVRAGEIAIGETFFPGHDWVPRSAVLGKVTDIQELPSGFIPKPQAHVTISGADTPHDYSCYRVLVEFRITSLTTIQPLVAEAARVLVLPAFSPEYCVTAILDDAAPQIALVTMQTNLWYWWCHEKQRNKGASRETDRCPLPPHRWEEHAAILANRLKVLRVELNGAEPLGLSDSGAVGIDGVSVLCEYRSRDGMVNVFEDRPEPSRPRQYRFVQALVEAARELLLDDRSARVLGSKQLHARQ